MAISSVVTVVDGASTIAAKMVEQNLIGLTIVACGTSLSNMTSLWQRKEKLIWHLEM